jgi:uncharacterized protein YjbI with pentapeptide repeats
LCTQGKKPEVSAEGAAMLANTAQDQEGAPLSQKDLNPILAAHERFAAYQGGKRAQLNRRGLDGLNLANRVLSEADFSGSSLVGATLYGSNLQRASLYCADLRGANLQAANLTRADMRGASFRGANLSYAIVDGGDLRAARMMIVGPGGMSVMDRRSGQEANSPQIPDGVDFTNCSMKHVSFGNAKLDNANFSGAIMDGAKFKGAKLTNAQFKGAVLTGVDLKELNVPKEALEGCVLDITPEAQARAEDLKAMIIGHELWISSEGTQGKTASLDGEDLRPIQDFAAGRRLTGLSMRNATALNLNFSDSRLQAAKFDGADLRGANFSGCDLRGASFKGANLSHATFAKARLGPLKLASGGELAIVMTGAVANSQQFINATVDCPLPELGLQERNPS